ncbi:MAG: T9SS type A sorting domain-containing protein [Tannerella sp.]|jgi:aminopeptidase N|nr:T9SS type A sorting domain-containing protein [Tannerella sp.]
MKITHLSLLIFACSICTNIPVVSSQNTLENIKIENLVNDNSGYDVLKYKLEFESNPESEDFSGKTTVYFKVLNETSQLELDAKNNLKIKEVVYKKQLISNYKHENNKLIISLPSVLTLNSMDTISVSFSGKADNSSGYHIALYLFDDSKKRCASYTFSESDTGPASWWVCKDGLTDKADEIELYITHPSAFKAVANGLLISKTDNNNGTATTIWEHKYPIPPYLVAFAVAEYEEYHQTMKIGNTEMPIQNYIYPGRTQENYNFVLKTLDEVPSYITYFNELFGEYPFKNEKYGHAEWGNSGAMEHSTITFMHQSWLRRIIIHELAHQWFGDQITCATWSDIWINEGFATFAELLMELCEGNDCIENRHIQLSTIFEYAKEGSVYNPEPDNYDRTFDYFLTYQKAGFVINQLKNYLGEDVFFEAIRNFLKEKQFGFVTTEDLKQSLMNFTGVDLTEFFNDWIYGEGYPVFDLAVVSNAVNDIILKVDQSQTHPSVSFFETPFKVEFIGDNNQSEIKEFNLTHNHQTFHITDLPFAIQQIRFNPHAEIIAKENNISVNNEKITSEDFVKIELNPVSNLLTISSPEPIINIQIFDISGRLVQTYKCDNIYYSIPTFDWSSNIYLIKVNLSERSISKKVKK